MKKILALLKQLGAKDEDIAEAQAELAADIETAKEAEVEGLKKKNGELLKKNKELLGEEGGKVADLEARVEELTSENAKLAKVAKAAEDKRGQAEKDRDDKVAASEAAISRLLIDGGLTQALAGKVKSAHLAAVKGLLARDFVVESDESNGRKAVASIKDKDGKDTKVGVEDYLKAWFATDEGKEFALDQGGSGGGAGGSGSIGTGATGKKARYQELNTKEPEKLSSAERLELIALAADAEATTAA